MTGINHSFVGIKGRSLFFLSFIELMLTSRGKLLIIDFYLESRQESMKSIFLEIAWMVSKWSRRWCRRKVDDFYVGKMLLTNPRMREKRAKLFFMFSYFTLCTKAVWWCQRFWKKFLRSSFHVYNDISRLQRIMRSCGTTTISFPHLMEMTHKFSM